MFYNQTHHFLQKKLKNIFLRKSAKIICIAFLRRNFSKKFKFSKFFVNRLPSARATQLLGAFGPQKWEDPPPLPSRKKLGGRHTEIAELKPSTVVISSIKGHSLVIKSPLNDSNGQFLCYEKLKNRCKGFHLNFGRSRDRFQLTIDFFYFRRNSLYLTIRAINFEFQPSLSFHFSKFLEKDT